MSHESAILVIVIGDPERGSIPALEDGWLTKQEICVIPAVQLRRRTDEWNSGVDEKIFFARHGRPPLEGEMGCAAAHINAYQQFLMSSCQWVLVLESDVRIKNQEELSTAVKAIQAGFAPVGQIFSLYSEGPLSKRSSRTIGDVNIWQLTTPPHGAVAYVLDRVAAERLITEQKSICNVADWPLTTRDADFYFVELSGVGHPTDEMQSTVAPGIERSTMVPLRVRLSMWLGLWFARHWNLFDGPSDYYYRVLQPRVYRILQRFGVLTR